MRNVEDQVVGVYRELLKTHKPSQIAMFGLSGGCQLTANTSVWLAQIKLPFPAALGLMTCAGGAKPGDTRITLDGLDPALSTIGVPGGRLDQGAEQARNYYATKKPGEPPREILDADIPKGFPPSYLLSGTRDMSLSHMALLHRKLRHAGVEADLNVFEGLWHGGSTILIPEAKDALTDFANFLDRHMGT
jgi:monoterpene epsilon-lactone hydrolase